MNLDKQLQELKKLPVDEEIKRGIYHNIQHPKKKNYIWKELALVAGIVLLAIVLMTPPKTESTATGNIQDIYKYFGGDEGEFYGRASTLYIGVDRVLDDNVKAFFSSIKQEDFMEEGKLGRYIADVVVVQDDGVKYRYQVSEYDLFNVDTGLYYSGESEQYGEVFNELYSVDIVPIWSQLIVFLLFIYQGILARMYKKKGFNRLKQLKQFKGGSISGGLIIGIFAFSISWHLYIGPLYQPILIICAVGWVYIHWQIIKEQIPTPLFYKVEKINLFITIFMISIIIMNL